MTRLMIALCLTLAACVSTPGEDPLTRRLIGAKVIYDLPEGSEGPPRSQTWAADGTTVFDRGAGLFGGLDHGRWEVRGSRYCSDFADKPRPPAEWTCWRVALSDQGRRIRFTEITGEWIPLFQREYEGEFAE